MGSTLAAQGRLPLGPRTGSGEPRRTFAGLLALVVAAASIGCGKGAGAPAPRRRGGPLPVVVEAVAARDLVYVVEGTGSLEAYQVVTVAARLDGVVEEVDLDEGDAVTPDTTLAVVDRVRRTLLHAEAEQAVARARAAATTAQTAVPRAHASHARATAAVERARAAERAARTDLDEAEGMLRRREAARAASPGAVSDEDLATMRSSVARRRDAVAVAHAALAEVEASLLEAEAAQTLAAAGVGEADAAVVEATARVATAAKSLADAVVVSPIAGVVRRRHVAKWQYVRAGDPVAELVDRSRLLLRFRVTEGESVRLRKDMPVEFTVPALSGEAHAGRLVHVDELASPVTRMVECLAEVPSPAQDLKPGFYAVARVRTQVAAALAVPESALAASERGWVAYVVVDGRARLRALDLGMRTADGLVEVRSGLAAGDALVVRGGAILSDGAAVTATSPSPPGGAGDAGGGPARGAERAR